MRWSSLLSVDLSSFECLDLIEALQLYLEFSDLGFTDGDQLGVEFK